jgi:D-alanyl-D-alanine carboxypeptidase (penicillin-binding protein 5/6)
MKKSYYRKSTAWIAGLLVFLTLSWFFPTMGGAQEFGTAAESAILMDSATGKILFEKNSDIPMPPASITKIMTLLIGFEALERGDAHWDDKVHISERAYQKEGSTMFLEIGKQATYEEIINGISVVSANDGCIALAEHLYGSEEAFVRIMNQKAKEIGLTNSQFKNSTGLPDEGHHMSARDIAILARYLINKFPGILEIESKREFTYDGITQNNRNPLLGTFEGADGLKTGWTTEAGYCLVGTAKRGDMRLISVVLRTQDLQERLRTSTELLNYGFKNFEYVTVHKAGDIVEQMDVKNGKELNVPLKVTKDVTVLIPIVKKDEIKTSVIKDKELLEAPVSANTTAGTLKVELDGELLAEVEIAVAEDVERAGFFEVIWRSIINFFRSLFKISKQ